MIETGKIINGDCIEVMKTLPEGSREAVDYSRTSGMRRQPHRGRQEVGSEPADVASQTARVRDPGFVIHNERGLGFWTEAFD